MLEKIRLWLQSLFIRAIQGLSNPQDREEVLAWLALVREILSDDALPQTEKMKRIYSLMDSKRVVQMAFRSVVHAVQSYKDSDLPWPVKVAIPVTLGAATLVGGQGAGIAAFGSALGLPVLLLVFLGSAGITSVLEAFLSNKDSRGYLAVILGLIAHDEILRQARHDLRTMMADEPAEPHCVDLPAERLAFEAALQSLDPFDFERHIMGLFQRQGLLSWVTKKSNDAGIDGFARHPDGIILVQCKRFQPPHKVGRPVVQQFKGVIEEQKAWRGYLVTTTSFSDEARESAEMTSKIILVDIDDLWLWHQEGKFL